MPFNISLWYFYKPPWIKQRFMLSKTMDPFRKEALTWKRSGFALLNPDEHHVQSCWSRQNIHVETWAEDTVAFIRGRVVLVFVGGWWW